MYRIDLSPDPVTGKRRQLSRQGFKNKKEAERALEEHLNEIRSGTHVEATRMTTGEYLDQWLENQKLRLKQTTWASYETAAARVKARLGARPVRSNTDRDRELLFRSGRQGHEERSAVVGEDDTQYPHGLPQGVE